MQININSLETRLNNIKKGFASDDSFLVAVIDNFMNVPVSGYLYSFPKEREQLRQILEITEDEEGEMTYKMVTMLVEFCWNIPEMRTMAEQIIDILIAPILKCYEERKIAYGETE